MRCDDNDGNRIEDEKKKTLIIVILVIRYREKEIIQKFDYEFSNSIFCFFFCKAESDSVVARG